MLRALALVITLSISVSLQAADIDERMSLREAIDATRGEGYDISYSTQLVKPWMRVRNAPVGSDQLMTLGQALAEYKLLLVQGPGGRWLVAKGAAEDAARFVFVSGQVTDASNGAPLASARIRAGRQEVLSDERGRFEFAALSTEAAILRVAADGYADTQQAVREGASSQELQLALQPVVQPPIEEITIIASRHAMFSRDAASGQFLTGDDIQQMPHIADDAFRALHRLPGVAANDFQAPFNLRGGAADEVNVVIDGLVLFEPFHIRTLYSPLSIIDPGIIGQAQVLSGGFTAEYGNQMSGIVDITTAWPDGEPVHQLGVSFVSSFARSSGLFAENRGAYLVSARRGYLDLIADTATDEGEELEPRYSDVFARVNYRLNDSLELSANVLSAFDDTKFVDVADGEAFGGESELNYGWLTAELDFAGGLQMKNLVFAGRVDTAEDGQLRNLPFESIDRVFDRNVDLFGVQSDITWTANDALLWKGGARYRNLSAVYDYRLDSLRQTDIYNNGQPFILMRDIHETRDGEEYGAYAAMRIRTVDWLALEFGLRWDKQTYTDLEDDTQTSPRVNALVNVGDRTELRIGWGYYHQAQGIENLQVQDGLTNYFAAQRAEHRVLGARHRFLSGIEAQLDIYEKRYTDLRPRFENVLDTYGFPPESNFDRVRIDPESARSRGIEITARRRKEQGLDWWFNYTWSKAEDTVSGAPVRRSWDQRHAVTGNLTFRGERWSLGVLGRYHSGWPTTPLLLLPQFDNNGGFIGADSDLTQRNTGEFGDYSRVDLRLSRLMQLKRSTFEYYVEVFNIFNTKNECCVPDHDLQFGTSVVALPNLDDYLPFFPSFGFVWTFGPGAGRR